MAKATVNSLTGGKDTESTELDGTGTETTGNETENENGDGNPAKKPKKPAKSATTSGGKKFTVWCQQDKCLPAREIEADSPAEAKEKYMEVMGIITVGHPLSASEVE
jgi:hypothetical protein